MTTALRTRVNGVTFAPGYPLNLADLQPRCEQAPVDLTLVRESDNAHDLNAISVELEGRHLGRIPADIALFLAPQLDQGITWSARAVYVAVDLEHPERPGLEIELTKES
jgi:hypothetical protein